MVPRDTDQMRPAARPDVPPVASQTASLTARSDAGPGKGPGGEGGGGSGTGTSPGSSAATPPKFPSWLRGLSAKLLLYTLAFVMLAEVLIFVPSLANFRVNWLMDRLTAAQLASLAAEAVPDGEVPVTLRNELLRTAQIRSVALKRNNQRRLVLMSDMPTAIDTRVDLRRSSIPNGLAGGMWHRMGLIADAIAVLFAAPGRHMMVMGEPGMGVGDFIEIVLPMAPLKAAMWAFAINIAVLSVLISLFTGALVYFTLNNLLVRPMTRITHNMLRFAEKPEDTSRIISPSERIDEVGVAERELAHMQSELSELLQQKTRLAALGLAVSKINHDLRNMLASAQLISDRLSTLPDPTVQRFAPKLIASLDRAINFCNDTLKFGRAVERGPRRELFALRALADEVGDHLGLPREDVVWRVEMDGTLQIDADRGQLYRVLSNLCRNAMQAIESQGAGRTGEISLKAWRVDRAVFVEVADDGPGIPPMVRKKLFEAFHGSRKGGTGLGLAIAQELIESLGGRIELVDNGAGTIFRFEVADRQV